ncbi:hypothetical protein EXE46_15790 [Halorubrum sp. GN11_10-6_MGM]|uniref:DUF7504 family protein n=1 Tax=Halorubrum sp. GN11_10-6_MGM TaxID=2518112 RepID=UPI0010F58BB7|nr:hypothetical protein [Halorubrum sp. GN11_10-6_MGM]TKX72480.1 hypothetical protein EXE46_15790 [Halorubrum sp. GN11_10-6_MGM]
MTLPTAVTNADAVLIDGPFLSGRRRVFHTLLRSWTDEPVIASTRHVADRIRRIHEQATSGSPDDPVVVDCVSAAHIDNLDETSETRYAAGPGNLTDIGTTITSVLESRKGEDLAVGVTTLSPLVTYTSVKSVFQFVHVLVNQATGQDWPVAAVAASPVFGDPSHRALREPFDAVIETRRGDADRGPAAEADADEALFRVRSRSEVTDWTPVSSV